MAGCHTKHTATRKRWPLKGDSADHFRVALEGSSPQLVSTEGCRTAPIAANGAAQMHRLFKKISSSPASAETHSKIRPGPLAFVRHEFGGAECGCKYRCASE